MNVENTNELQYQLNHPPFIINVKHIIVELKDSL